MSDSDAQVRFEQLVMPHLDDAYNLARWLAGNDHDAQDIAQEACLRAFRFLDGCRGSNSRAWLLTIVRNTAFTWFKKNRPKAIVSVGDDQLAEMEDPASPPSKWHGPDAAALRTAIETLPLEFREALVLRELEDLSYKEIADITGAPVGTVMSRLARARKQLQDHFQKQDEVRK